MLPPMAAKDPLKRGEVAAGALQITLNAHATKLATGYALLDGLTGGRLDVTGAARTLAGGGFGFTDLQAAGRERRRAPQRRHWRGQG